MDYYTIGEITGKTYRLGHLTEQEEDQGKFCDWALREFSIPPGDKTKHFVIGFYSGIAAVDKERSTAQHD